MSALVGASSEVSSIRLALHSAMDFKREISRSQAAVALHVTR